ncbi:twin-arginine translocation signal domain-containing protein [Halorussus lipolyticus]|uniref:twin-arginine translocation signal domain-containing protein n=1 Tax=Halorussus lipolyticus TaxID=3034024 RepID=UPI0023E84C28|nr:twin-arginine translocation signal domain-containing protein [Halorussus sp. DT80]
MQNSELDSGRRSFLKRTSGIAGAGIGIGLLSSTAAAREHDLYIAAASGEPYYHITVTGSFENGDSDIVGRVSADEQISFTYTGYMEKINVQETGEIVIEATNGNNFDGWRKLTLDNVDSTSVDYRVNTADGISDYDKLESGDSKPTKGAGDGTLGSFDTDIYYGRGDFTSARFTLDDIYSTDLTVEYMDNAP